MQRLFKVNSRSLGPISIGSTLDIKDSNKEQAARAMFYETSTFLYFKYIVEEVIRKQSEDPRLCLRKENIDTQPQSFSSLSSFS